MQASAEPFEYQSSFILDKTHFRECYEESVSSKPFLQSYGKAIVMLIIGAALVLFSEINPYAAWFIFSLGVLEVVSTYYRKPWWVMRQMLSKAAKSKVVIEVTSDHIRTHSFYADNKMPFTEISVIEATQKGWLITHTSGRHYISNRCLSEFAQQFIADKKNKVSGA